MQWLNKIVDEIVVKRPEGKILIESGGSPSGTYHLGHLRELITADAILLELKKRGRQARHIYFSDDLDALRKIPVNIPAKYEKYLGMSLCDISAPEGDKSYSEYFLQGLIEASAALGIEVEFTRSHEKYRAGFFIEAIERSLERTDKIRQILENVSGHKLGDEWSPIQVNEDGYLKKRRLISIDTKAKTLEYADKDGQSKTTGYAKGEVKLDWRIDWPARWWLLDVAVEPFGRDHATKGGSYDTGAALVKEVLEHDPPLAVPYDFVNLAGDTKKMSASKGTGLDAIGTVKVLPPEIIRFFMLRYPASKRLYFDPVNGVAQLIDEFGELLAKNDKSESEKQLINICLVNIKPTVSRVPFSHLVASFQAALKDPAKTIDLLRRSGDIDDKDKVIIKSQLLFIDQWLQNWAPEDIKFELTDKVDEAAFDDKQKNFLSQLAEKIENSPKGADGEWFHKTVYELESQLDAKEKFKTLYKLLINKEAGPRAGWFLSLLPRDKLIKRLRLENENWRK